MASLREYTWSDGVTKSIQVRWRENGVEHSTSFTDRKIADLYRLYLEAEGSAAADAWLGRQTQETVTQVVSLDEMVAHYIAHLTSVSEGTRAEYAKLYRRTYGPLLGALPVDAVTRDKVSQATLRLSKQLAQKTVRNARGLLAAAYTYAVEHEDFPVKTHPCRNIRLPSTGDEDTDDINYLTHEEFGALFAQVPEFWQPLVLTLAGTGMRWGEATALTPRHVDLRAGTVRIRRAWKRVPGGWEIGPPKTRKSRRTVALPPELVPVLTEQKKGKGADDFLFTSRRGVSHVHHANFRQRVWVPAIQRAQEAGGLSKTPRIHDLRHSHVAWLIAAGVHLVTIQQRLGHESIQTTIDVYGDLMPDLQVQAAHAASQALAGLRQLPAAGSL